MKGCRAVTERKCLFLNWGAHEGSRERTVGGLQCPVDRVIDRLHYHRNREQSSSHAHPTKWARCDFRVSLEKVASTCNSSVDKEGRNNQTGESLPCPRVKTCIYSPSQCIRLAFSLGNRHLDPDGSESTLNTARISNLVCSAGLIRNICCSIDKSNAVGCCDDPRGKQRAESLAQLIRVPQEPDRTIFELVITLLMLDLLHWRRGNARHPKGGLKKNGTI